MRSMIENNLENAYVGAISGLHIHNNHVPPYLWNNTMRRVLKMLVDEGVIKKNTVCRAIHNRLKFLGREGYERHCAGEHIDDASCNPEAVAYALAHNGFSLSEQRHITLTHGTTVHAFIRSYYTSGMVERIYQQLVTPVEQLPHEKVLHLAMET